MCSNWGFDPWGILRRLKHVRLSWVDMPDGARGRTNGVDIIWLHRGQQQTERRCALAHELVHVERNHTGCQAAPVELQVCLETARRLIPIEALVSALRWSNCPDELADELWVTPDVLKDRMRGLTSDELALLLATELQPH